MDNFFEVLIYLIIIISFLSSLFKKKEVPKSPPNSKTEPTKKSSSDGFDEFETSADTQTKEDFDILAELENIFNEDFGKPKSAPKPEKQTNIEYSDKSLEIKSPNYEDFSFETSKALEAQSRFKRREITVDSKIEKAAELFEQALNNQRAKQQVFHPLVKKIRNPKMIKDYIVVSEILQKPLALRK